MMLPDLDEEDFSFFQKKILSLSGIHLTSIKKDLIRARLTTRLRSLDLESINDYRLYLESLSSHDKEWQILVNQITTNKTDFFRESAHFKYMVETFLPRWVEQNPSKTLRVWSAASSSGEEAYTLSMILHRYFRGDNRYEIFGSDIDTEVLQKAKNRVYPIHRLPEIPVDYQGMGVTKGSGEVSAWFKIKDTIASRVKFDRLNLLEFDAGARSKFDLIFCRNVFIYFQSETIQKIVGNFYKSLNTGGAIILGHSESIQADPVQWKALGSSIYLRNDGNATSAGKTELRSVAFSSSPMNSGSRSGSSSTPASFSIVKNSGAPVLLIEPSSAKISQWESVIQKDPRLTVKGKVSSVTEALAFLQKENVKLIVLGTIDRPLKLDEALTALLERKLVPIVLAGPISDKASHLKALEYGAVDVAESSDAAWNDRLFAASQMKVRRAKGRLASAHKVRQRPTRTSAKSQVLVIGSSTGGVQALTEILTQLPAEIPPTFIVQHIPPVFSHTFAERLNSLCAFEVREARDGDLIEANRVLIAPGGKHMELVPTSQGLAVRIFDGELVNRHKPSVDVLFHSAAKHLGPRALGVILTGMGNDGAQGLLALRNQGAYTLGQDEASSAVYGMPKEAARLGAVAEVVSLDNIPSALIRLKTKAS